MTLGIFSSCTNAGWSFPNFPYTTTYFPNQFPLRTLIFGDYIYDNSGDNKMQFVVSATTGGVYKQTKNITVGFSVDNTLADNLWTTSTPTTTKMAALPANWYTLSNTSQIIIPAGRYDGGVTVQLTTDFFADTNAIVAHWVLPLRMTSTTADSILSGKSGQTNPDPRISSSWAVMPKNYTIFGIRYVNEWHGRYILRGRDVVTKASDGSAIETINYHTQFLEGNTIVPMTTFRRNAVKYSNAIKRGSGSPGNFEMRLDFGASDITQATLSTTTRYPKYPVAGTAKMVLAKDIPSVDPQESWGNIPRNTIYLAYTIIEGTAIHTVNDTLVFRDKNVAYADFVPKVILP